MPSDQYKNRLVEQIPLSDKPENSRAEERPQKKALATAHESGALQWLARFWSYKWKELSVAGGGGWLA